MRAPIALVPVVLLLSLACTAQSTAVVQRDHGVPARLDALATALAGTHRVPGMALIVMRGDETVLAKGYGRTEIDGGQPVTETTVFQIGSVSKQFLAALVLRLAEEQRLSLDDAVTRHLPEFATLPPSVTVRHLLNHTSGMRELFAQEEYRDGIDDLSRGPEELTRIARESPVDFEPGSRWAYSNTGYTTLALLVERLTGQPYERALAERLFVPLGLSSMRQCTPLPRSDGEARGHVERDGAVVAATPENMHWIRGDGGLCGNARDVARWTRLLHTGKVVAPASHVLMTAPTPVSSGPAAPYGFALSLIAPDGRAKIAHGGAMLGFSAMAAWYPDDDVTIIVLTNRGDAGADGIERRVARNALGVPEPARTAVALTADDRARVLGTYDIGIFDVRVTERDGDLWLEAQPPAPTLKLTHVGGGRFIGDAAPDSIEVLIAHGGIRLMMGAMHWYGVRR